MIVQVVRASIKPEHRDLWLKVIERNVSRTRAERGCQEYQVAEDLERPNHFVTVEEWTDLDAVKDHFRAQVGEVMAALRDAFAAPPEVSIHEVGSTLTLDDILKEAGIAR